VKYDSVTFSQRLCRIDRQLTKDRNREPVGIGINPLVLALVEPTLCGGKAK
jgi:hypothetical protein